MSIVSPTIKYIDFRNRTRVNALGDGVCTLPWMNIMLSGGVEYILNGTPILLSEGHIAYFKIGDYISRRAQQTNARYLSIRFQANGGEYNIDSITPIIGERQHNLITMLQSYYFGSELGEAQNRQASELLLGILLRELENNCRHDDENERIEQIRKYVFLNYMKDISNSDVAEALTLSTSYCNTIYKKYAKETIGELICRIRLNHAISKLSYSLQSISEVARECGFQDVYYFSRWFRKRTQYSPKEFRSRKKEILISEIPGMNSAN